MMQKLKGRQHGDAAGNLAASAGPSCPDGGRPSTFGGSATLALTPDRRRVRGGVHAQPQHHHRRGASAWGGFHHAEATTRAFGAGLPSARRADERGPRSVHPRRRRRARAPRGARARGEGSGDAGFGAADLPPLPPRRATRASTSGAPRARGEVSFMDAKNLRRKSPRRVPRSAPAPETLPEAFKLVCLTAPRGRGD